MERAIQMNATEKDPRFILSGPWKKFVRRQDGYKIFAVDGAWVRRNLSVLFGHGGHGFVHEFIPHDEIWVGTRHYNEGRWSEGHCDCKVREPNQAISESDFRSTTLHEIVEHKLMKAGKRYWPAHQQALRAERDAGWMKDPYDDR